MSLRFFLKTTRQWAVFMVTSRDNKHRTSTTETITSKPRWQDTYFRSSLIGWIRKLGGGECSCWLLVNLSLDWFSDHLYWLFFNPDKVQAMDARFGRYCIQNTNNSDMTHILVNNFSQELEAIIRVPASNRYRNNNSKVCLRVGDVAWCNTIHASKHTDC